VLQRVYKARSVFFAVNASLHWLNKVTGVYLVQISLLLIGQQGLGYFFWYRLLLFIGWKFVQSTTKTQGKRTIQRKSLLVHYKYQGNTFLSMRNYTLLVISENDKNKQLTLLSQCKLALIARNTPLAL
jgi:hypothetical protein